MSAPLSPTPSPKDSLDCSPVEYSVAFQRITPSPELFREILQTKRSIEFVPVNDVPKEPWGIVPSQEEQSVLVPKKEPWKIVSSQDEHDSPDPKNDTVIIVSSQEEQAASSKATVAEKETWVIVSSDDDQAVPPLQLSQNSPELFPSKRMKPAPNPRTYDSVSSKEFNRGVSTPDLLEALDRKEGTIEYRNGIYEGQLEELRPHGKGVWRASDGSFYDGDWAGGEYHGEGSYRDARDNYYNGSWKKGKRDGTGVYLFRNGDWYQGEWHEGNMHGKGEASYARTGDIYRGHWKNNLRHGHGISYIACRRAFKGRYITFEGEYRHNERHGTFVITTPQGSQCTLDFKDNKPIAGSSRLIKISANSRSQLCLDKWIKK